MPQRTLADARRVLEENVLPTANDYNSRTYAALRELTEVRDGFEALAGRRSARAGPCRRTLG